MQWQRTTYGHAVVLESGEEIVTTLQAFAEQHGVRAGAISGIGAVGTCELGFFIRATKIHIVTDPDVIERVLRPDLGFNPLKLRDS